MCCIVLYCIGVCIKIAAFNYLKTNRLFVCFEWTRSDLSNFVKMQPLSAIAREHRHLFHDDAELKLNIAIDNVYWQKKLPSTSVHRDRSDSMDQRHFQQLWLRHRYCKQNWSISYLFQFVSNIRWPNAQNIPYFCIVNLLTCICICVRIFTWWQQFSMRTSWCEMLFWESFPMKIVLNCRHLCAMRFSYSP